jgi:Zn-dependent metalloprotease
VSSASAAPGGSRLEVYVGERLVRKSGDAPTGDLLIDRAFENLARVDAFTRRELGRKGWDDKDGPLRAQLLTTVGRNAYFDDKTATIHLGQRNGGPWALASFGWSPTVMGHEIGHALQTLLQGARWALTPQVIGMEESFADVMGLGADDSDWVLGDEMPGGVPERGVDLRDLAQPPYKRLQDIPEGGERHYTTLMSYAAVLTAATLGKVETRKLWYEAMKRLPKDAPPDAMRAFADAVLAAATALHGPGSPAAHAVTGAYAAIGIF